VTLYQLNVIARESGGTVATDEVNKLFWFNYPP